MSGPLLIAVKIAFQQIRKKEEPEDHKHDEQLNQDDPPEISAPGHPSEAVRIESEYFPKHSVQITQQNNQRRRMQNQMYYFYLLQIIKNLFPV
jgi:hypothetical protein